MCTTCDVLSQITSINSNFVNTLSKFSFINNGKRILSMNVNKNSLPIIASLKFYSMCGVILGHRFLLSDSGSVLNIEEKDEWLHTFGAAIVFSVINYVDTFLVITGFLTSYLFFKEMAKGRKFNLLAYYVHRYMR
ncbi:hypothetical protein G9C98_003075 [Cotesia typhae]|uniref:Uncharacterized protein n=1 Tax=Cotesia typhae TaxID=2053667 RepID=A0A8J5RAZ0_9HYME|nr:hypothetical protein G9C98_003075 [Cotesia typhae]